MVYVDMLCIKTGQGVRGTRHPIFSERLERHSTKRYSSIAAKMSEISGFAEKNPGRGWGSVNL